MKLVSVLTCAAGLALCAPAFASLPASDNADDPAYSGGWTGGTNGGYGWFPWVINVDQASGFAGTFLAGAGNGDLNNIKSPNHAWGIYANNGGVQRVAAYRRLTGDAFNTNNLVNGQTITIFQENGSIQGGGFVGMSFGAANLAALDPFSLGLSGSPNGQSTFGFFGGDNDYKIIDADGTLDTGIGFTDAGLRVDFTLVNTSSGAYNMTVTRLSDNTVFNFNGRHINGGIDSIGLYNYDAEFNDQFFNSVAIVPGPGSMALLGLGGLLAARRRR
ncbi:MAG TPA: hypothetical protein VHC70_03110 [Phycisphaerales bacterium]|jgi:hypothetical protein|nr:hypothetical protein [Phycisphaerales bacterium]